MARRMPTISEMYNKLKGMFVDKTSTTTQIMSGNILTPQVIASKFSTSSGKLIIKDLGDHANTDSISKSITQGENGIYKWYSTSESASYITIANFSIDNTTIAGISIKSGVMYYFVLTYATAALGSFSQYPISNYAISLSNVMSLNANLSGIVQYGVENSTLHIRGTFTPTATIAAGTKLFNTGQALTAKMTHGSAINTGATGAETFVGISIQTNGDVYCLGALTSGVTYNIAVTATL